MAERKLIFRRVVVNDLPKLRRFWESQEVYSIELEKCFTEFQILTVEEELGDVLACCGLKIEDKEGLLHHKLFASGQLRDQFEKEMWERIGRIADNHGLVRLWVDPGEDRLWQELGFEHAAEDLIEKSRERLPIGAGLLTLKLREEVDQLIAPEDHFELFQKQQVAEREKILDRANKWKQVAVWLAVVFLALILLLAFSGYLARRSSMPEPLDKPVKEEGSK